MASDFETLVAENWSQAVFAASREIATFRPQLLTALGSIDPEVRSAAVAALYEGDDRDAHDAVVALLEDPAAVVRDEVLEYMGQFATTADIPRLFDVLTRRAGDEFGLTTALRCASGMDGEVLTGEEQREERARVVERWRALLEGNGLLCRSDAG